MDHRTLAIGIDIGGTNTVFGLVNRRGEIIGKGRIPTIGHATIADFIESLHIAVTAMLDGVNRTEIAGVGIGAPNANYYTGEIANAANLEWKGVIPLARLIEDALGLKATVTNDANAAAIGEMTYGVARGMSDFIMVTLGTGVGSGFVANGQVVYGHDGFAGELGHVIVERNGRLCGCGRKGCLETYASATGIVRTAHEWLRDESLSTSLRQHQQPLTASIIQQNAEAGDKLAIKLYEYTGEILGRTLADIVAITSPQSIVFFGGLCHAGKLIIEPTQRAMEENMMSIYRNKISLVRSALPDADAAILGASALVW
jgi:glucokinase